MSKLSVICSETLENMQPGTPEEGRENRDIRGKNKESCISDGCSHSARIILMTSSGGVFSEKPEKVLQLAEP